MSERQKAAKERAIARVDPARAIGDLAATKPIAENPDLEQAIAADFANLANHAVYADWLSERGDPRGELIACSLPTASLEARARGRDLLARHAHYFAGRFEDESLRPLVETGWTFGWLTRARLTTDYRLFEVVPKFVFDALPALLALPSAKFLDALTLGAFDFDCNVELGVLYPILRAAGPRPSLRRLFLGDIPDTDESISNIDGGTLSELAGLYPNLTSLKLRGGRFDLAGGLDYPKLESLTIESGGLGRESVGAVVEASFPRLTNLELWFGAEDYGGDATADDLETLLRGERTPRLVSLGLRNAEFTDDICDALVRSPLAGRLMSLDLSLGTMTDSGAAILATGRFPKLASLDVSNNCLSEAGAERIRRAFLHRSPSVNVVADHQKHGRFVSVGE